MLTPLLLVTLVALADANAPERQLLDQAAAGEKLWAASCRKPAGDGASLAVLRHAVIRAP